MKERRKMLTKFFRFPFKFSIEKQKKTFKDENHFLVFNFLSYYYVSTQGMTLKGWFLNLLQVDVNELQRRKVLTKKK